MLPILLGVLGPLLGKVVDTVGSKLGVDLSSEEHKFKKAELELELQKLVAASDTAVQAANMAQIQVNQEEAKSTHLFVAGWRPFIGWICGIALGYHFILQPLLAFTIMNSGVAVELPVFDMASLTTVLMGMLGLGAMRSYEKGLGVKRERGGRLVYDKEAGGKVWRED